MVARVCTRWGVGVSLRVGIITWFNGFRVLYGGLGRKRKLLRG